VRRFLTMFLLVGLALVGLAACGDDDDDTTSGDDDAVTTTRAAGATGSAGTVDFSGSGSGDFCDLLREYDQAFADSDIDFTDKDAVRQQLEQFAEAIDSLEDEAPDEIAEDVRISVTAFRAYLEAFEAADYDVSKVDQSKITAIDTPEVREAGTRLDQYGQDVCGIEEDSTTPTTGG
jgi:hypothetical protein